MTYICDVAPGAQKSAQNPYRIIEFRFGPKYFRKKREHPRLDITLSKRVFDSIDSYGIPIDFLMIPVDVQWIPKDSYEFPIDFIGIPMDLIWISLGFQCISYGFNLVS